MEMDNLEEICCPSPRCGVVTGQLRDMFQTMQQAIKSPVTVSSWCDKQYFHTDAPQQRYRQMSISVLLAASASSSPGWQGKSVTNNGGVYFLVMAVMKIGIKNLLLGTLNYGASTSVNISGARHTAPLNEL